MGYGNRASEIRVSSREFQAASDSPTALLDRRRQGSAGKRKQIFKSGFARKADADNALRLKMDEKTDDALVKPDPSTFRVFMQEWFHEHADRNCTPKTTERYRQLSSGPQPQYKSTAAIGCITG